MRHETDAVEFTRGGAVVLAAGFPGESSDFAEPRRSRRGSTDGTEELLVAGYFALAPPFSASNALRAFSKSSTQMLRNRTGLP